jgi:hypothetical protein
MWARIDAYIISPHPSTQLKIADCSSVPVIFTIKLENLCVLNIYKCYLFFCIAILENSIYNRPKVALNKLPLSH